MVERPLVGCPQKTLLFSDIPRNVVMQWNADKGVSRFLERSGYTGAAPFTGKEPGSNGLTFDPQGRLTLCQHGDRRVSRAVKRTERWFPSLSATTARG